MERHDIFKTWPYNLALHILKDTERAGNISVVGFFDALGTLNPREQAVLTLRMRDKLSLEKVGEQFGLTRERIRQIQAKAEHKLRHPSRQRLYLCVPTIEFQAKCKELNKLQEEYEFLSNKLEQFEKAKPETSSLSAAEYLLVRKTPIEELNLTVRAYNALKRAGKDTVGDVMDLRRADLYRIRNLGETSIANICEALKNRGVSIKLAA